jgi:hypothetical protein
MSKLTLSVDSRVVERAKEYAAQRGTSVSQLVEQYLEHLSRPTPSSEEAVTPLLRQLRAELKGVSVDIRDYQQYLRRKYR